MRRLWLSLTMLALGGALMVVAQLASAAPERKGGGLESRDDRRIRPGGPAARLHHDRLVARVRHRGKALQLPGQARTRRKSSSPRGRVRVQGLERGQALHVLTSAKASASPTARL